MIGRSPEQGGSFLDRLPKARVTRRIFGKGVLAAVAWAGLRPLQVLAEPSPVPLPELHGPILLPPIEVYARRGYQPVVADLHMHTSFSDAVAADVPIGRTLLSNHPTEVMDAALQHNDVVGLSDHAEQLDEVEQQYLLREGARRTGNGRVVLFLYETTATKPERADGDWTYEPSEIEGWHCLVLGTERMVTAISDRTDQPPGTLKTFEEFMAAITSDSSARVILAHPSLYRDFTGGKRRLPTFSNFRGIEVVSHGPGYTERLQPWRRGLQEHDGNEEWLISLLGRGAEVGVYAGSDLHIMPYAPDDATVLFVRERTTQGVLEAIDGHRTNATGERGATIYLTASTDEIVSCCRSGVMLG